MIFLKPIRQLLRLLMLLLHSISQNVWRVLEGEKGCTTAYSKATFHF